VSAKVTGADRLLRALAAVEDEATATAVHLAAAEIVLDTAKPGSRSSRVRRTGRTAARKTGGVVRFGGAQVPWTAPSHFGHRPRPQGGFMRPNPFLWDASDRRRDDVTELYFRRMNAAITRNGLA
jgi:hypothetical protein